MKTDKEPGEALEDYAKGIAVVAVGFYVLYILYCVGLVVSGIKNQ